MMSARSRMAAGLAVAAMAALGLPALPAAASPSAPPTPANLTVKAKYGGVQVSWSKVPGRGVTYSVSSTPAGKGCTTIAKSCFIAITDATPWQFSVTASSGSGTSAPSSLSAHYLHRVVLIVAGQSNATGWESYSTDPTTGKDYLAAPYTNGADSQDQIVWAPWDVLKAHSTHPVALDTPQIRGTTKHPKFIFGPEIGLARQLWADKALPVTIIKAAYPGSWMASWDPSDPTLDVQTGTGLFSGMVALVKKTMEADAAQGQLDTIGGFYWYQGEQDSLALSTASAYQANLTNLIGAVRTALPATTATPIIVAESDMSACWNATRSTITLMLGNSEVRGADVSVAHSVPNVWLVDTAGLPRVNDGPEFEFVHLSNISELSLGRSLATASENQIP